MTRGTLTAIVVAIAGIVVWYERATLLLVFLAILVAIVLDRPTSWIQKKTHMPRALAAVLTLIAIGGVAASSVALRGDAIASQFGQLARDLPVGLQALLSGLDRTLWGRWIASALSAAASGLPAIAGIAARAGFVLSSTLGAAVGFAFVVFVAVCLTIEPTLYLEGALRLVPVRRRDGARALLHDLTATLRAWLVARLISMIALGTFVTIGLSILRIPLAGTLGVVAGLLAFIPNVGAICAAAPAILIAFTVDVRLAAIVALMYWVAHTIDDFLVIPIAERTVVKLPPALTVTAQLVLAGAAGFLGIMLAAPLVAVTIVVVKRLWVEDTLERSRAAA